MQILSINLGKITSNDIDMTKAEGTKSIQLLFIYSNYQNLTIVITQHWQYEPE